MNINQNVYFYIIYVHISATKFYVIFLNIYKIDLYKLPNTKYNQTRHDIDSIITVQIILLVNESVNNI